MIPGSAKTSPACLVVGYGSIGTRHASVLKGLGLEVAVVTHRDEEMPYPRFRDVYEAVRAFRPGLVVVATPTAKHYETCVALEEVEFRGVALIEKPVFATLPTGGCSGNYQAFVGYTLRFHPAVSRLREILRGRRVFSAQLSVGQYLPQWRPGTDYRQGYSAKREQGGGVLRDLSHELDLALWFFGRCEKVAARVGRLGELDIDSDDTADILLRCERCPSVNIHLDYQNLFPQRRFMVQASGLSVEVDFISGVVKTQDAEERFPVERNFLYAAQAEALLQGGDGTLCTWAEGCEVVACVEAIEAAATAMA
jgi:predicted dehydrogenase